MCKSLSRSLDFAINTMDNVVAQIVPYSSEPVITNTHTFFRYSTAEPQPERFTYMSRFKKRENHNNSFPSKQIFLM